MLAEGNGLPRRSTLAAQNTGIARDEALGLAREAPLEDLLQAADRLRSHSFGQEVYLCAILNARSGACGGDCRFCAQGTQARIPPSIYPLVSVERMMEEAAQAAEVGVHCFGIVTSGAKATLQEVETIAESVARIRREIAIEVAVSLGMLGEEELVILKQAGISRYHHNLETSRAFFPSICSTHRWEQRLSTLQTALRQGIPVCSGGLFGLGETWEDRIDLACTLRDLGIQSIPINFLHPIPGTPFEEQPLLSTEEALRIVAIYRLLLPTAILRICGGRPRVLGTRTREVFRAGANGLMTGNYLTVKGIAPREDLAMLEQEGLRPVRRLAN